MTHRPLTGAFFRCVINVFICMTNETIEYLDMRASKYGGTAADILDKTPSFLWDNPDEIRAYWDVHDLSHVFPRSMYPDMTDDWTNIVPENASDNRARGAAVMTHDEIVDAELDTTLTALDIDSTMGGDDPAFAAELVDVVFA